MITIDGSQRFTQKNKRFLILYNPASTSMIQKCFLVNKVAFPSQLKCKYQKNLNFATLQIMLVIILMIPILVIQL